jgi:hypothetical protein
VPGSCWARVWGLHDEDQFSFEENLVERMKYGVNHAKIGCVSYEKISVPEGLNRVQNTRACIFAYITIKKRVCVMLRIFDEGGCHLPYMCVTLQPSFIHAYVPQYCCTLTLHDWLYKRLYSRLMWGSNSSKHVAPPRPDPLSYSAPVPSSFPTVHG